MAPVPVFHATVSENGKLVLEPAERYQRQGYLRRLAGKSVDVVVKPHRHKRSDAQNRFWWGVAVPLIAHELGYDKHEHEALHYALVNLCFGTTSDPRLKQDVPNARSSQLTTAQFSELMEWAVRWAATEYGIVVPLPHEAESA
jgi:hypothetical protein